MPTAIFAKRLTHTDLTWFRDYFEGASNYKMVNGKPALNKSGENIPRARQKAINMDAKLLYRMFPVVETNQKLNIASYPLDIELYGPGTSSTVQSVTRPLLRQQKNWRLNGQIITSPTTELGRYGQLVAGDVAIIELSGAHSPVRAKVLILSQRVKEDANLITQINKRLGSSKTQSMVLISANNLDADIKASKVSPVHPSGSFVGQGTPTLAGIPQKTPTPYVAYHKRKPRRRSKLDVQKMHDQQTTNGDSGEAWFDQHLALKLHLGAIKGYEWISQNDAFAPYDFRITLLSGQIVHVDVKSTSGDFSEPFFLSIGEIREAALVNRDYIIARISDVNGTPVLETSTSINQFAKGLLATLEDVAKKHAGVAVPEVNVGSGSLKWKSLIPPTATP